jgi:hypothetical protein
MGLVSRRTKLGVQAEFFKKLREGSRVKQKIVTEYFVAYNRVMTPDLKATTGTLFSSWNATGAIP